MFLIQPELTSAMWMKPSLFSYSSRVTKAPKFITFATVQTTSSPTSGHSYACRAVFASAITRGPPGSRLGPRPSRPSASRPWRRSLGTTRCSRRGRRRSARCRNPRSCPGGTGSWASGSLVHLHELELLRADARPLVGLLAFPAAEAEMDLFRRLLATFGLRAGEATVPGRDPPEPPLARPELGPRAVLHPLDLELHVLVAERTVTADTLGHLHGGATEHRYRGELLFEGSWVAESISAKRLRREARVGPLPSPNTMVFRSATRVRRLHRNKYILLN